MENSEDILRVRLSLLLTKELTFNNTTVEFQQKLEEHFKVKYTLDAINDELEVLSIENQFSEDVSDGKSANNISYTHILPEDYDY